MDKETWDLSNKLDEDLNPIRYGDEVLFAPLSVGGRSFHFDAPRIRFIYALQKTSGNLEKSCAMAGVSMSFAQKFLASRKFREFRNLKLAAIAARNGDLITEWWQTGVNGMRGFEQFYSGTCDICHEDNRFSIPEAEMFRQDDMSFKAACKICFQPIQIELQTESFRPTREQVQFWDGIGNRLVPKVERVHHEFSAETFVFQGEGDNAA